MYQQIIPENFQMKEYKSIIQNILSVISGAFTGLDRLISRRTNQNVKTKQYNHMLSYIGVLGI